MSATFARFVLMPIVLGIVVAALVHQAKLEPAQGPITAAVASWDD